MYISTSIGTIIGSKASPMKQKHVAKTTRKVRKSLIGEIILSRPREFEEI